VTLQELVHLSHAVRARLCVSGLPFAVCVCVRARARFSGLPNLSRGVALAPCATKLRRSAVGCYSEEVLFFSCMLIFNHEVWGWPPKPWQNLILRRACMEQPTRCLAGQVCALCSVGVVLTGYMMLGLPCWYSGLVDRLSHLAPPMWRLHARPHPCTPTHITFVFQECFGRA